MSKMLDKAIELCDGICKYTGKIERYEDKRKAKYAVVSFDGTILADGFKSKDKAKDWAKENGVDLKG